MEIMGMGGMRRVLFAVLACIVVGYAAILAGAFLVYAVGAMDDASRISSAQVGRFGSPMGEIGMGIGAVIAAIGVLLVGVRYLIIPRLSEVWKQKEPDRH